MNASERIQAVARHSEPDRVPMHINASQWVVERLMASTNRNNSKELLNHLNIDVYDTRGIDLHSGSAPEYIGPKHDLLRAGKDWGGNIMALWNIKEYQKDSAHGKVLEIEEPPLLEINDVKDLHKFPWPEPDWFSFSGLRADLENWKEFSIMASGGSVFQHASYLTGLDVQLIELLTDPAELEKAQNEFKERTGGGGGGSKWVAPLLSSDFKPPVDLRWPEYITTERGEEWCIPTPD